MFFFDKNPWPIRCCLQPWPAPGAMSDRFFNAMTPKPSKIQSSADPKPSSCKVSCFRKKNGCVVFSPLCRGGGCFFCGRIIEGWFVFLWKKYEISNELSFGLHHMAAKEYQPLKQDQPIRDNRFSPVPQKKTASCCSVLAGDVSCTCCTAGLFCITSCILKLPGCEDCQQKSSPRETKNVKETEENLFKWHRQCNESL